jgi:hypothetical protein
MAIELALAIEAVRAVSSLVTSSADAAKSIRSGFRARNEEARRELETRLAELGRALDHAGALARAAEAYSRTLENIVSLLQACGRVRDFLQANLEDLSESSGADYHADWRVVDAMFDAIRENQSVPRAVLLDRAEWYDQEDKDKIELRLSDFNGAFRDASKSARNRFVRDLENELRGMISPLEDVEFLLRATVYDKILRTLEEIG